MPSYLSPKEAIQIDQLSFIGGKPRFPDNIDCPKCSFCGAEQTFFFQVELECGGVWKGKSLAIFQCTDCIEEEGYIPRLPDGPLKRAHIPFGFFDGYQTNFTFLTFETMRSNIRQTYVERVEFRELQKTRPPLLRTRLKKKGAFGKLGGRPNWQMEDESPSAYARNTPFVFLAELAPMYEFSTVQNAPPQAHEDYGFGDPLPLQDGYDLFVGNALYLFGTKDSELHVYAVVQPEGG